MNLDDAQRAKVAGWMEQGLKLSEIQSKLASELGVRLTYMDVRFLIDDLKLKVKDAEAPKAPETAAPIPGPSAGPAGAKPPTMPSEPVPLTPLPEEEELPMGARVSVNVDQLARPGAMVSGKVTFSDGKSAEWYLDQYGRLGLAPQEKGYRPSQQDVMAFQAELQNQLGKMGY